MKSPVAWLSTPSTKKSISRSASWLMRSTFSLSLKSKMGVQVSGIFTPKYASKARLFFAMILLANRPGCPGVLPYVAAYHR